MAETTSEPKTVAANKHQPDGNIIHELTLFADDVPVSREVYVLWDMPPQEQGI